jgi:hypothetical protein
MSDDTPTPSEIQDAAESAPRESRIALMEASMSDIDAMVHSLQDASLENLDSHFGELAAIVAGIAAVLRAILLEQAE